MNPVMLCFLRFPRVFDLICHSEYLPSSKVPLNKSTHRSFWAICLTFTSSFHLRSPRTTCRREPGNSAFIWTTQPSNEQIFTPKFDLWVGHGQILDVQKSVKVRLVTCDFSPFSDAKIGSPKKNPSSSGSNLPSIPLPDPGRWAPAASWRRPWVWSNVAKISCHSIKISEMSRCADLAENTNTWWILDWKYACPQISKGYTIDTSMDFVLHANLM